VTRLALLVALPLLGGWLAACSDVPPLYEGMPEHVKKRHIVLDGAANFRDLGGYATRDGRTVRWGKLYRSDNLAALTDRDLEIFSKLGIALICDFRGPDEWQEDPDRLPEANPPEVAHLEIWDPSFTADGFKEKLGAADGETDLGMLLVEGNRLFAGKFSDRYKAMFERITRPENLPALVHCTAGKDRAGFASALILRVLDVPMDTVYEDFLLTNHYTARKNERLIFVIRAMSFFRTDAEALRGVLGVEKRFLEAAFDEIDQRYGSFETYRREALGLSDEEVVAFRSLVLE
jgi:protein-tyrosine phosphatase